MADDNSARGVTMREGKVPWELIADAVRSRLPLPDDVLLGPAAGEDAALLSLGGELWALASDPITFAAEDAGRLAVLVNANDVAVRGARPRFFTAVLLVAPDEASPERVASHLGAIQEACAELGVALVGGHTEVTPGLPRRLVVGTMLGRVEGRAITTGGLQPGDVIGLTRAAGLEGTAILHAEHGERVAEADGGGAMPPVDEALGGSGLTVVSEALALAKVEGVHALHDVTEGGVGEALHELGQASGLALEVARAAVPVKPATLRLCAPFGIDPLGLIGSGALLVGCAPEAREAAESALAPLGVPLTWIGHAASADEPGLCGVPRFPRDELLRTRLMDGVDAVLFDMDGTLIDAEYDWRAIRDELGVRGRSIIDELDALAEPERGRKWARLLDIERAATRAARLHGGAHDLLDELRRRGLPTALVTNNTEENTRYLLERFELRFDEVLTRDTGLYKPSGAPLVEASRRLGVPIERCLELGDSRYDLAAAEEAGCRRIVVVGPGIGEAWARGADHGFADLAALVCYLRCA